ncbi:MAG: SCO family protein [Xanthobacteraceae bacterium]
MRARHWLIAAAAGVVGFAAIILVLTLLIAPRQLTETTGVASIGGPFTLIDDTGKTVTDKTLFGKPYAMYFGYRYCPDVCPTTLFDLTRWIKDLGPDADKMNYVFVTVDPERDTPKLIHEYLASFDHRIRGFTGTPAQIAKIAKEYRVYYKKVPTSDGSYLMDHSAMIYLMTAEDKFDTVIPYQEKDSVALAKLKNLIATTPSS